MSFYSLNPFWKQKGNPMPEVVYATPSEEGKPRNWNEVFPIWDVDIEQTEWRVIDKILEAYAMNNRYGGLSLEEEKARQNKAIHENFVSLLDESLASLQEFWLTLPKTAKKNINRNNFSVNDLPEKYREQATKLLEERKKLFLEYGWWQFYISQVNANVAGAYREYK